MGVSNLAHCYEKRALIEFALGDYAGALQDAEAVQDRLAEARALDKERFKEIGEQTERLFIDLMAIHLLQGNRSAGCALFNEKPLANMNEVPFPVQEICASAPQAQSERRSPGSEIDDVVRNGRYSRLPPPKMLAGGAGFGPSHISLVNKTRYTLTVIFSGPAESTASVQAGQAVKLDLIPGVYRVLGRVDDSPTVLPLLGSHEYSAGTEYESAFSIAP
jgi:hypothetical protein